MRTDVTHQRMARLRALIEEKQAAFRLRAGESKLSVITLKSSDAHRRQGVTPALSDNFLPVEITGVFPANQMLWTAVSHPIRREDGSAQAWRATLI